MYVCTRYVTELIIIPPWKKLATLGCWILLYSCEYFCKKNLTIIPIIFYGEVSSGCTVSIDPTIKPIISGY